LTVESDNIITDVHELSQNMNWFVDYSYA